MNRSSLRNESHNNSDITISTLKLFKCKILSLIFCILGTILMLELPLQFIDTNIIAAFVPAFTTGYIIINISIGIFNYLNHFDLFTEIWFSLIGLLGNYTCGIYLLWEWTVWLSLTDDSGNAGYGLDYLSLSLTCCFNAKIMLYQLIIVLLNKISKKN